MAPAGKRSLLFFPGTQPPQKLELSNSLFFYYCTQTCKEDSLFKQTTADDCVDFHTTRVSLSILPRGGCSKFSLEWNVFRMFLVEQFFNVKWEHFPHIFTIAIYSYCLSTDRKESHINPFWEYSVLKSKRAENGGVLCERAQHHGYPIFFGRRSLWGTKP